jgi:hypothetical protein
MKQSENHYRMPLIQIPEEWAHLRAHGLCNVNFLEELATMKPKTQSAYMRSAASFLQFSLDNPLTDAEKQGNEHPQSRMALKFLQAKRATGLKSTSLQGMWSHLIFLLRASHKIDLQADARYGQRLLNQWRGEDPDPTQAAVFTIEQLNTFYESPLTALHTAHIKVYSIMATHGAERTVEAKQLTFEDILENLDATTGKRTYSITFDRLKLLGSNRSRKQTTFLITAPVPVAVVKSYIDMTPEGKRTGRFYRYNLWSESKREWFISEKHVGSHELSKCGKHIARALQLPNIDDYTGHCFKRTAGTLQALVDLPKSRKRKATDFDI